MYADDFEYDGKYLSDFGFMVCSLDSRSGSETSRKGSEITFHLTPTRGGRRFYSMGSEYETCLSTSFQICKNPEFYRDDEMEITGDEFRALSRWLNRREFLWFHGFDWCEPEKQLPWVRATFTLTKIDFGKTPFGIQLDMITDSPFCYGEEVEESFVFTSEHLSAEFIDRNDVIGECFPALTIKCRASGTLTLSDDITGCACAIKNCTNQETITFSGETLIVSCSLGTHDIANDFNYDFFRFANTYDNKINTITASAPCEVTMTYRPTVMETL